MLLICARKIAGKVDEGHKGNVERIAEPDEPGRLVRRVHVQHAGEHERLVSDDADGFAVQPGESDNDVRGPVPMDFEEVGIVRHCPDDIADIVRFRRIRTG